VLVGACIVIIIASLVVPRNVWFTSALAVRLQEMPGVHAELHLTRLY